jgi:hypothetical protein
VILVDASVIIDYDRKKDAKLGQLLLSQFSAICGVTRAELLHGARLPAERSQLIGLLNSFVQIPIPDSLWDDVGDHLAILRHNGLTVPFQDAVVVTVGISLDIDVWARDAHFPRMQQHLPALRLFVEPP